MKVCSIFYAFLASMVFMTMANQLFAQDRGSVGVNVILKPIQTIHLERDSYQSDSVRQVGVSVDRGSNQLVSAFGTAAYELTVDKVAMTDSLNQSTWMFPETLLQRNPNTAVNAITAYHKKNNIPPFETLIVYSIQVN